MCACACLEIRLCEGVLSVFVVFDLNCTSLITEERDSVSKTVRVSQIQRKTTTASPGDHGKICLSVCLSVCVRLCV